MKRREPPEVRRDADAPRGLLRRPSAPATTEHRRLLPCAELAPTIAHFWWVRWELQHPTLVETLPHPTVHLTFEAPGNRARISGIYKARFSRTLAGIGRVFGIKFRPATFQPLLKASMTTLTDRVVPLSRLFTHGGRALARRIGEARTPEEAIALAEAFLIGRVPLLPPKVVLMRDLVERLAKDRSLLRVEDAAACVGMDVRTLQRSFNRYVGVSPKWVIQRYRLHEAAEQLKSDPTLSHADLAAQLGYFDQSHFVRDFKAVIGRVPTSFLESEAPFRRAPGWNGRRALTRRPRPDHPRQ